MRKNVFYLVLVLSLGCLSLVSCSEEVLSDNSVVRETITEQNEFDKWLKANYLDAYNIQFKYRFEDIESSMGYYLTPADFTQSVYMAKLVLHMCLQAYDEITGSKEFIKTNFPKILYMVGSYAYKTNGTVILGTAEAGAKISLYNLDNLNPKTVEAKTAYFKTIHHEFGHILNQTKPYTRDFSEISGPDYVLDKWADTYSSEDKSLPDGFITPYASHSDGEDFVELVSIFVTRTPEEWEERLVKAGAARGVIEDKFEIVCDYMDKSWGINLPKLREIVLRRASEARNLDFDSFEVD